MLRDFQQKEKQEIYQAWQDGAYNVMPVMPTGSGKTVLFCDIIREYDHPACVVAHRQELVSQAALSLNRERVPHGILAPKEVVRQIVALEQETHGYSMFNARAPVRCAGVDTIIKRDAADRWFSQVGLLVQDEGHHVLKENKWGRAQLMVPNARGMFPTAHGVRADRKGLGREADGLVDRLIVGPYGRELINRGFLTDYRLVCVGSDIEFNDEWIGPSGDYSLPKLRAATHKSNRIVGDVVKTYLKFAPGKLGITFAVDKDAAKELRDAYCSAGVPAEVITDETPITVRVQLMKKFRARQILQLVSVDCLGEGVDVPAIEVVSMVRKTASWQLFCQQFGRALRVLVDEMFWPYWDSYSDEERLSIIAASTKPKAIIIDHVGNVIWHAKFRGLPDSKQEYSLLRGDVAGRGKSDAIPLRPCLACAKPFERFYTACPYCGWEVIVQGRGSPELVEGDLIELDPEILAAMRGEVARVNGPLAISPGMPAPIQRGILRNHHERFRVQQELQQTMMLWGGWQSQKGLGDRESQKLFYIRFGVDILTAQTLGINEAGALNAQLRAELDRNNVVRVAA